MPVPVATVVPTYTKRHLRFGWWSLAVFAAGGLALETLHGFKIGAYLDVTNESRRLMWTLAHAHGALLALVNVAFALSLHAFPELGDDARFASLSLIGATVLLPAGFFLAGVSFYAGDPGLGIALVPLGAACLLASIVSIARPAARVGGGPRRS